MDACMVTRLWSEVERELRRFDGCFGRVEPRAHLRTYVRGQMSDLPRKSIEPIALDHATPPRTLQKFLANHAWDEEGMRDRMQRLVATEHADDHAVVVLDDTAHPKKGRRTPGVKRQYCGATGKIDNCTISVHLAFAGDGLRCLLDSELFVPEEWADDPDRRRMAGVPPEIGHRPKWRIGLEMIDRVVANGVRFRWLTFDEGFGQSPEFLLALSERGHRFVAEIPPNIHGWIREPRLMHREHGGRMGRPRRMPRVFVQDRRVSSVENLRRHSPALRDQRWTALRVKETTKGPLVWEFKESPLFLRRDGLPTAEHRLLVARAVTTGEIKYFLTNAPASVALEEIVSAAFTRWTVERCFEDAKTELGLSHFEVRNWRSLTRHLLLTALGLLVLARVTRRHRPKSGWAHDLPDPDRGRGVEPSSVHVPIEASRVLRARGADACTMPTACRTRDAMPSPRDHRKAA
jgi:SRSO17 transposase